MNAVVLIVILVFSACSFYRSQPKMEYYHGQNAPEGYILVEQATETAVIFRILIAFKESHLYHLLLEENEPLAQGWFPTQIVDRARGYTVSLTLKKGLMLEPGKTYRLCIGGQNPEAVQLQSSSYRCLVDHSFVYEER
ncbi:MAG: hypothetical protein FJY83_03630 [Candidatus Aminicenantes bacterium]|nr:hypothetical protein [Candidatus Aminicenantes bacterium]